MGSRRLKTKTLLEISTLMLDNGCGVINFEEGYVLARRDPETNAVEIEIYRYDYNGDEGFELVQEYNIKGKAK